MSFFNVIIYSVVKNCGNVLDKNISLAVSTGQKFKNYKIVIYEIIPRIIPNKY
uniref:Uncharacterized protein n=1 Tax=viral metagenome TaxID=1070528 RepID=A0A6C0J5N8_9ZZZZ